MSDSTTAGMNCGSGSGLGDPEKLAVEVCQRLSDIGRDDWNAAALADADENAPHPLNPFIAYDFLEALEVSGSVSARAGWLPQHLRLKSGDGATLAVMPLYLKSHSQGEYVFDHSWAHAFESAGGDYYPKLQCAVPFTPVTGPRVLVRAGVDRVAATRALTAAALELTRRLDASSLHVTFLEEAEWKRLGELGLMLRTDRQFHWKNQDYPSFDGFLDSLSSRKRKNIRKERARALDADVRIEWLTGDAITDAHWDRFFDFYVDTGERKWGMPYLTRAAFTEFGARMKDHILLIMAHRDGHHIAGALNFIGAKTLFGRYWGCTEAHDFLHFEVCYYQAMDYAIAHKLETVEAGAQGEHKLMRGYMPVTTYSAHHIRHPGLARAVGDYLDEERRHAAAEREILARHGPFRRGD